MEMTALERLQNARECYRTGRYSQALEDLIWFHENALLEDEALYGVRLSFALGNWIDLSEKYPQALQALQDLREKKAVALMNATQGKAAFVDIVAIDGYLNATDSTYSLFQELLRIQPELAKICGRCALPSIIDAQDFQLAASIAPDPEAEIRTRSKQLNVDVSMLKHRAYSRAPSRWAYVCNFVEAVQRLISIQNGIGEHMEAARLKNLAISLIESPSLRREVQSNFVKRTRPKISRR